MAIKIAGTTVVDDSRGLTNIASVDATTATAIGAAGVGGGGTHQFVASGAISNGDVVVLNSDGTVSVVDFVDLNPPTSSSPTTIATNPNYDCLCSVFDSNSNKVIVFYEDLSNSNYGTAVVGTVSGTSITFGTPVVFQSSNIRELHESSVVFDSTSNKIILTYRPSNGGRAIVGTVSGTSISFGTAVEFTADVDGVAPSIAFDKTNNKVIVVYRTTSGGFGVVGTVSGTSISFGSATQFNSGSPNYFSTAYDSTSNKIIVAYYDSSGGTVGKAVVGTVSGTAVSFGSEVTFSASQISKVSTVYASGLNKVIIFHNRSSKGRYSVGTVSGNSISFASDEVFSNSATSYIASVYDSISNRAIVSYFKSSTTAYFRAVTFSGSTISFGPEVLFSTSFARDQSIVYDPSANKFILSYYDIAGSGIAYASILSIASTTASSYIGIAAEDIADTATGEITIIGGVVNVGTFSSYDIANASYDSSSFSVSSQVSIPYDVAFDSSGTIVYILSWTDKVVYQYTLSTAYDISTASYGGTSFTTGLSGIIYGMHFSPDGTKMFVIDNSWARVHSYSLSTAWDVSTASLDSSSYNVYSEVSGGQDVALSPDGTKMYVLAGNNNTLYQYTLATAFDLSAVSYSGKSLSVTSQGSNPNSITFNGDGTKLFILINNQDSVFQYSLSTAYDISTASYDNTSFSVATQETTPLGLAFSSNGVKMFVVGNANDTVFQYATGSAPIPNTSYFVADDGALTTTNNGRKIGKAISASELQVKTKLTGSEMNEYLGGLV